MTSAYVGLQSSCGQLGRSRKDGLSAAITRGVGLSACLLQGWYRLSVQTEKRKYGYPFIYTSRFRCQHASLGRSLAAAFPPGPRGPPVPQALGSAFDGGDGSNGITSIKLVKRVKSSVLCVSRRRTPATNMVATMFTS